MGELLVWNKKYDTQCFCDYCTGVPGWREYMDGEACPSCPAGVLKENPHSFEGWLTCTECNLGFKGVEAGPPVLPTGDTNEPNN